MEGRKRSRALSRTVYSVQKRLLAFVLAAAMILTNVGADLNTALAATSSESVTFSMSGSQLVKAIDEAIANGNEVTAEDLDFTNGKIAEFEKLFFGEGKIYEAFPDPDGGSMDAELRVFVRLPEDADDMYMVTGDEEIIFLYVNNGEDSISCTTEITRMDDGAEKVKKTKRVTVKSYEAAYGDEEVNLISKPVETPAPLPEDTNRPGADETTAPAETESQVETTAPSVDGTTAAPDDATDETTTAPDETTAADGTQATLPDETTAAPEESQTEEPATTEAAEEKTQEATEPEKTEAPETEAPEAEAPEAEVSEPVASIIRHNAPLVADNENGDAAGTKEEAEAKEETEAPEPEKEEEPKETEAPTKEEATTAEETDATEAPTKEESTEAADSTDPTEPAQDATDETTTAADGETTVPGTDETTAAPVESGSGSADESETKAPAQTVPDVASPSEAKPTEAPAKDDDVSAAGTSDLVGIGYCSTAKVYVTTINQLKALDDFEGYKISYAIYPEASARIVEGPRGVEEGQALSFGVKNQIGYAVESVTANGEILLVDSITDNDDGSQTAWYSVPEIYEEQEVEVYMTETGEHPAVVFDPIVMEDGTVIHIQADEGVLPAGVQAVASVVYGIEDAVKANVEAEASGETKEVVAALSYNIDLLDAKGNKLDDQIWSGAVQVTFTGAPIEEKSREADVVEVMYVETTKEEVAQADISSGDVVSVEAVSEAIDVADGASIKSISFEANHFSVYTITFKSYITSAELKVYVMNSATGAELGSVNDGFDLWTSNVDAHKTSDLASDIIGKMGLTSTYRFDKATIGASYNSTSLGTVYYKGGTLYQTKSGNRYSNPITQLHFWFRAPLITFHANGGSGGPTSLSLSDGKITLPEPEDVGISNNGKTFVGWSTDPSGKGSVYIPKIEPSDSSIKEGAVLYAIWIDEDGTDSKNTAYFYIRIDGEIQYEPARYGGDLYYPLGSATTLVGSLKTPVSVNNNLDNVAANLQSKPTDEQIKSVLKGKLNYNPATQRIEWYVIKYRGAENGRTYWNVDGVIRDNEKFELKYNPNGGDINVPGSNEYAAGSVVNVRFDTIPNRAGYDFLGWDENKDASYPTYTREGTNKTILINDNTELFAIWRQKGNVTINYAASVGGRVSRNYENLAPVTGVAQGSTAIANAGYHFVRWTNASGKEVSTEATYVPPKVGGLNVAATYTAHFEEDSNVTINYVAKDGGHVNKSNETLAPATGKAQGSRAVADEGYKFDGWYYDFSCTQKIVSGEMFIPTKESDDVWVNGTTYYAKFVVDEDKTKNLTATVDYRLGEEIQTGDHIDLKAKVQVLQPDTLSTSNVTEKTYTGWKLESITINDEEVAVLPSTVNNGDAVIYNYIVDVGQTKDLAATVDYKLGATTQTKDHIDLKANVQVLQPDTLSTSNVTAKTYTGWKLVKITINDEKVESLPGLVNNGDKVVYWYLVDVGQTKDLAATVDYKLGDEIQTKDRIDLKANVQVLQPDTLSTINVTEKTYTGWKLESITINDEEVAALPSTVNNGDAVIYNYIVDVGQTKDLAATVDYKLGDEIQTNDRIDLKANVQVLQPDTLSTINVTEKTYTGWKLESITINDEEVAALPSTVNNGDAVIYNYIVDVGQTKDLAATVDYKLGDEIQTNDRIDLKANVQVLQPDTLSTSNVTEKTYTGWKLESITINDEEVAALPSTVNNGDAVIYNYIVDVGQTKDLAATVDYKLGDEIQTKDRIDLKANVQVLQPDTLSTINVTEKTYTGWKLESITINDEEVAALPSTVNNGDAVIYNYIVDVGQTKDLAATVDYKLGATTQTKDHIDLKANVQVLQPDTLSTSNVTAKTYTGWKLVKITINDEKVESLPGLVNNGDKVVYWYLVDVGQTKDLAATVDYKLGDEIQTKDRIDLKANVQVLQPDTLSTINVTEKTYTGWKLESITINDEEVAALPSTVNNGDAVIYNYIVDVGQTKDLAATVDYKLGDEIQTKDRIDLKANVQVLQPDTLSTINVTEKTYTGWKLESITINDEEVAALPSTVNNGDAVIYNYIVDVGQTKDLAATVDYKLGDEIQTKDRIDLKANVQVLQPDTLSTINVTEKTYTGWKLESITINDEEVAALPSTVNNGDAVIYNYIVDVGQTKDLAATVDYKLGDEIQTKDRIDLKANVQVLQPDTLSTINVTEKTYTGWKLESITINDEEVAALPSTVNNGDAVIYNYIVDVGQTKDLAATVDYKLGATTQTKDHIDLKANVQVLQPDTLSTSNVTAKTYTGWKLVKITINDEKVESLPGLVNNGDKVVYWYLVDVGQTKDLAATVDYKLGDEIQTNDRIDLKANVQVLQPDTLSTSNVTEKTYTGWKLESITINDEEVAALPSTVNNGDAVIYNYIVDVGQTKDLAATVDYKLGDEIQTNDRIDLKANVQVLQPDTLSTSNVTEKTYTGWKLESITINDEEVAALPSTVNNGDAVIYNYIVDVGQTKDLAATVDYKLGATTQTKDHIDLKANVQVLQPDTLSTINVTEKTYTGWKLESITINDEEVAALPSTVNNGDAVIYNYIVDVGQTKDLAATVDYKLGDEIQTKDRIDLKANVQVLQPDTLSTINVTEKTYTGWKLESITINDEEVAALPSTVNNGDAVIYNYIVDVGQTKDLAATVDYKLGDEIQTKDRIDLKANVQVLQPDTLSTINVTEKTYTGWKLESITINDEEVAVLPSTVNNGDAVIYNYIVDVGQTKDLAATVDYKLGDEIQTNDRIDLKANVQVLQPDTLSTINVTEKTYTGWKLESITINDEEVSALPSTVNNGDAVIYNYIVDVGQTKDLAATVDYKLGDEIQTNDRIDLKANVQVLQPDTLSTSNVTEKTYTGWKLESITINDEEVAALPSTVNNGDAVIYNYIVDVGQTKDLAATVDYKLGDEIQTNDRIDLKANVQVLQPDTLSTINVTEKTYTGWKLESITINDEEVAALPSTVNNGDAVIYNYIVDVGQTKDLAATVDYKLGDEIQTNDRIDLKANVQVLQPDTLSTSNVTEKTYTGWKLESITINDEEVAALPSTVNNGDAVIYNYIVDVGQTKDLAATVDYKLGDEIQTNDHIDLKANVQVLQPDTLSTSNVTEKTYTGWKLNNITINDYVVNSLPAKINNGDAVVYNYEKETYDYIVEYYKGTLDSENKIGTSEKLSAKYHDPIILGFGTDNGQLDSMRPAGYLSGVQQEAPYIIGVKGNIIKVLYVADKVDYVVHMYYQTDGSYPDFDKATYVDMRQGFTDSEVEVTADDLLPVRDGYVLDTDAIGNRYKGTVIAGEGYLILRVYFKQQFTVTYEPGTYGVGIFNPSVTNELDYGSNTPGAPITELGTPGTGGYVFAGWEPKVEPTVTKDATYVAQWIPSDSTKYTVEFYYENAGKYPAAPDDISLRAGTTDATGAVTDTDKTAPAGYILDSNAANVFEAKITGDGNMVLRVYFKQQFTVTYNPGEHGSFDAQSSSGLSYGDKTPAFSGQTTANGNYRFSGWDKEIAETVTGNAVYTALWSYNSNTGGGSTGGGGGNPGRVTPSTDGGPGAVTINPEDVPLAQLPGAPVDPTVIDDGEIPLAALPKTGQSSVKSTLTMMMSGIFLMLTAMSKKRKEEDS